MGIYYLKKILKTLSDIGFDGPLSFECLPIPDLETASVDAIKYIKQIMADLEKTSAK